MIIVPTQQFKYRWKHLEKPNFSQYKIINGKKLPNKWTGKVWALKQGVNWAVQKKFSHLSFYRL